MVFKVRLVSPGDRSRRLVGLRSGRWLCCLRFRTCSIKYILGSPSAWRRCCELMALSQHTRTTQPSPQQDSSDTGFPADWSPCLSTANGASAMCDLCADQLRSLDLGLLDRPYLRYSHASEHLCIFGFSSVRFAPRIFHVEGSLVSETATLNRFCNRSGMLFPSIQNHLYLTSLYQTQLIRYEYCSRMLLAANYSEEYMQARV